MKRDAARSTPTRSRPRKKPAVADAPPVPAPEAEPAPVPERNVGSLEGGVSLAAGVLLLVGALFPRTVKQLVLLSLGGWLAYRGVTGRCDLYGALGLDTAKGPLLPQLNDKYLATN